MNRLWRSGWLLPLALAVAGVVLIIAGQLEDDASGGDPTPTASRSPVAAATPPASVAPTPEPTASPTPVATDTPSPTGSPTPTPSPTYPPDVVAQRLQIPSAVPPIDVAVFQANDEQTCDFPPAEGAYIICGGLQPGRRDNAYIFAHALPHLFKPLWNLQLGQEVLVTMSDGSVLRYVVTEVRPNVPCPDPNPADPGLNPPPGEMPLVLQYAESCEDGVRWTVPTPGEERLTLQTSQGYNRNWGEFVVIAEPPEG